MSQTIAAYAEELSPADATALRVERGALQVALQRPEFVNARLFDALSPDTFRDPRLRAVHRAMVSCGGISRAIAVGPAWPEAVMQSAGEDLRPLVGELAVSPLPAQGEDGVERYARGIVARLFDNDMVRISGLLHSRLQRTDPADAATSAKLLEQLTVLEVQRSRLRQQM